MSVYWIQQGIAESCGNADPTVGIDLNGDGVIDDSERLGSDGNGQTFANEWGDFWNRNGTRLAEGSLACYAGFFLHYSRQKRFKYDNPIHDIFFLESRLVSAGTILGAYEVMSSIVDAAKADIASSPKRLNTAGKLRVILDIINRKSAENIGPRDDAEPLSAVIDGGMKALNNDQLSLMIFFVAHELGLHVNLANARSFTFLRFKDVSGNTFNWTPDGEAPYSDVDLVKRARERMGIQGTSIRIEEYDDRRLLARFFLIRALEYERKVQVDQRSKAKLWPLAKQDYQTSLSLDDGSPATYVGLANHIVDYDDAEEYLRKAIALSEASGFCYTNAHYNLASIVMNRAHDWKLAPRRGYIARWFNKRQARKYYTEAIDEMQKVMQCNKDFWEAYSDLGYLYQMKAEVDHEKVFYDAAIKYYSQFRDMAVQYISEDPERYEYLKEKLGAVNFMIVFTKSAARAFGVTIEDDSPETNEMDLSSAVKLAPDFINSFLRMRGVLPE